MSKDTQVIDLFGEKVDPDVTNDRDIPELDRYTVPIPGSRYRGFPWARMDVGQSFEVTPHSEGKGARNAAYTFAQNNPGWRVKSRRTANGFRFWRIS